MRKLSIILLVLCILFSKSYSQCDDDECYQHYKSLIKDEKEDIKRVFDGILEKYGDVDGILRNLLNELNKTIHKADENLNNFDGDVNRIKNAIELSNSTVQDLLNDLKTVEDRVTNTDDSNNWIEEIQNANNTANLIIPTTGTLDDVKASEDEIEKWRQFLEKFYATDYGGDIMNIPHSVSDDLSLLETLLNMDYDSSCFIKFQEDLKNLFAKLANLLNIDSVGPKLTELKERANKTKTNADGILGKTEDFLEKERNFKNVHDLANETLYLAGEIEDLKNNIDKLLLNNEEIFDQKLKDLQKSHQMDLEELHRKYKADEYLILLDELEDINKQIEEISGGNNINITVVEEEIKEYMDDLEYYTCILNDCRYRKPAEAVTSFNCQQNKN